ncbi:MAG: hypothetical protein DIU78_017415 [Pseudomonadota bacterium]
MFGTPRRTLVSLGFALGLVALTGVGCSRQGEGERCDLGANGHSDCDDGLFCTPAVGDVDRCCPPQGAAVEDPRCVRSGRVETGSGGSSSASGGTSSTDTGGATATGGADAASGGTSEPGPEPSEDGGQAGEGGAATAPAEEAPSEEEAPAEETPAEET